jgi:arylsulfate sulfotransferase
MIRLEMTKKQELIIAALIVLGALAIFALQSGIGRTPEPVEVPPPLISVITGQMERQARIDSQLLGELDYVGYGFNNPLVRVDPYGMSPLTALVLFYTDEPMRISVHIAGRTEDTSVSFSFVGFNTRHVIPIYGLYPDSKNLVELTATTQDGTVQSKLLIVNTKSLPEELTAGVVSAGLESPDTHTQLLYFTFVLKSAFDVNGDYRWVYSDMELQNPSYYLDNGNFITTVGSYDARDALRLEVNKLGRLISINTADADEETISFDALHVEPMSLYTAADNDFTIEAPSLETDG